MSPFGGIHSIFDSSFWFKFHCLVIYNSTKHFFSWMTPKALCLQVSLHEVGYLKQKSVCFQEKNNALSVDDVSKRQADCHLNVAAAPFWGSH